MTEKEFDDIFKSLNDVTETPGDGIWEGIERRMARRRRFVLLRRAGMISAAAAIVIAALLLKPETGHETAVRVIEEILPGTVGKPSVPQKLRLLKPQEQRLLMQSGRSPLPSMLRKLRKLQKMSLSNPQGHRPRLLRERTMSLRRGTARKNLTG